MQGLVEDTIQNVALNTFAQRFAELLNADTMPIVWNANPKRTPQPDSKSALGYPIMYLKVVDVARNQHTPFKRQANTRQLGNAKGDGTRPAIRITPVEIGVSFKLVTDNPLQAFQWTTDLVIYANTHEANAQLAFNLVSDVMGANFSIPTQAVITSDRYDIAEVEYAEDVPMEYEIVGTLTIYTRANIGKFEPELISTLHIDKGTDPDRAVANVDGSTDPLYFDATKSYPIRIRSDITK